MLIANPAWVTRAIAKSYETLEDTVQPNWLPKLTKPKSKGVQLVGAIREYGCGSYGCVVPTLDSNTVLKVTTDETEAQFAAELAPTLVVNITVAYHLVMRLDAKRDGRTIYLLWRESADHVGEYESPLIDDQHAAAQDAFSDMHKTGEVSRAKIDRWTRAVQAMASERELEFVASGILRVFKEQGVFFGDLHAGNFGRVKRPGHPLVITDPGHIARIA